MVAGVLRVRLIMHGSRSLKDKRRVLKGVMEKVGNRFNVSIAEVGSNDLWQTAELGVSVVGTDGAFVNCALDKVLAYIEGLNVAEITDHDMEIINY